MTDVDYTLKKLAEIETELNRVRINPNVKLKYVKDTVSEYTKEIFRYKTALAAVPRPDIDSMEGFLSLLRDSRT